MGGGATAAVAAGPLNEMVACVGVHMWPGSLVAKLIRKCTCAAAGAAGEKGPSWGRFVHIYPYLYELPSRDINSKLALSLSYSLNTQQNQLQSHSGGTHAPS